MLGFGRAALTSADGSDDLVNNVDGACQAFEDVGAFLSLLQVELGAADHHVVAMVDEVLDQVFQVQGIRTAVDQGHVVHVEGALEGGHLVELVQHHLGVGVAFQFVHDADALTV